MNPILRSRSTMQVAALVAMMAFGTTAVVGSATYSPAASAVSPADYPLIVKAIDAALAGYPAPSATHASQLWNARAFYMGASGTATEIEITLTAVEAAELGVPAGSGMTPMVSILLHGTLIAEVAVLGTELYLLYYYDGIVEEEMEEFMEAAEELGQDPEEAAEEFMDGLYDNNTYADQFTETFGAGIDDEEGNTYADNLVDMYCFWCDD